MHLDQNASFLQSISVTVTALIVKLFQTLQGRRWNRHKILKVNTELPCLWTTSQKVLNPLSTPKFSLLPSKFFLYFYDKATYPRECWFFCPLICGNGVFQPFCTKRFTYMLNISSCYEQWILVSMKMLALREWLAWSPNIMQWPIFSRYTVTGSSLSCCL